MQLSIRLILLWFAPHIGAFDPFPGTQPGVEIGAALPALFEPSGATWIAERAKLVICDDEGYIAAMNIDGSNTQSWPSGGSWEGITHNPAMPDLVFVIDEQIAQVQVFNISTGSFTGQSFALTSAVAGAGVMPLDVLDLDALQDQGDTTGVESLAFVPDANGGMFWAGSQENGFVYQFRFDTTSSNVSYWGKFKNWLVTNNDLSGLEWDPALQVVFAVWDSNNVIRAISRDGLVLGSWNTPAGNNEEGIVSIGNQLVIAEDQATDSEVWRYDQFLPFTPMLQNGFE
jgi:hypothetical protein